MKRKRLQKHKRCTNGTLNAQNVQRWKREMLKNANAYNAETIKRKKDKRQNAKTKRAKRKRSKNANDQTLKR